MPNNRRFSYDEDDAVPIGKRKKRPLDDDVTIKKTVAPRRKSVISGAKGTVSRDKEVDPKNTEEEVSNVTIPYKSSRKIGESQKSGDKGHGFRNFYIGFAALLLILSACAVIYVHGILVEYENAQPDKIAQSCADNIKKAAQNGKLESVLSFDEIKKELDVSDEEIKSFEKEIAESTLTYKKAKSDGSEYTVYNILCDNLTIAELKLKSVGQKTRLAIFTLDVWEISPVSAVGYSAEITLPSSVLITADGAPVEGTTLDNNTVEYTVRSITKPDIVITDALGNSAGYSDDGKYDFKQYHISVPSNYTLMGKDAVSLDAATVSPDEAYRNIIEYFPDMPGIAEYELFIMGGEYSLSILDNTGKEIDISNMGTNISLSGQIGVDALSDTVASAPDPLEVAKLWSNFMTDDIGGARHGFNTMAEYLFGGSSLYDQALAWATGVDITFTSKHTLSNPPFTTAEVGNFVIYSDKCFSCEILLEKPLHIVTGDIVDKIHSTFYFGYIDDTDNGVDDPHWGVVDIAGIVS